MPPVEDDQLIRLLRATNAGDTDNDLSSWMCRRCYKKGVSVTQSAMSSREPTASSDTRESSKSLASDTASEAGVASSADVRVQQELVCGDSQFRTRLLSVFQSTTVYARLVDNREPNTTSGRQEAAPVTRTLSAKRTKQSAANRPHVQPQPGPTQPRDVDVQMADATPTKFAPQEKKKFAQRPASPTLPHQVKAARKLVDTVSATSTEDDVEMNVDYSAFSEPTSRATSQASRAPSSDYQAIRPGPVVGAPYVRAASSASEREREVRPADRAAVQPRVNQDAANEVDDDPDDLYGPPVERRIIRILPSMAEELREQQRRVAAEKVTAHRTICMTRHTYSAQEKRRAPLAPDWILARHANDPSWKEIPTEGRKRRKPSARKLGDNGLNVNELIGCFTVQNWVREHKA